MNFIHTQKQGLCVKSKSRWKSQNLKRNQAPYFDLTSSTSKFKQSSMNSEPNFWEVCCLSSAKNSCQYLRQLRQSRVAMCFWRTSTSAATPQILEFHQDEHWQSCNWLRNVWEPNYITAQDKPAWLSHTRNSWTGWGMKTCESIEKWRRAKIGKNKCHLVPFIIGDNVGGTARWVVREHLVIVPVQVVSKK